MYYKNFDVFKYNTFIFKLNNYWAGPWAVLAVRDVFDNINVR